MSKSTALVIPSEEHRLGEVREFVSRFCQSAGLPERGTANLRLAVDQVCSFGIQQAYAAGSGELRVELDWKKGAIEVRVRDAGAALEGLNKAKDLVPWLEGQGKNQQATVLLHNLVDGISYTPANNGKNVWFLRKKLPRRPRFQGSLRSRYAVRSALVLGVLIAVACVPLWIIEGNRQRQSEEQALQALAFGLVEASRPALGEHARRSPEQKRLQETVLALKRREPRLLTVHVIDSRGVIWAADRSQANYTKFTDARNFGEPDAQGMQRSLKSIEGNPVMLLSMPVTKASTSTGLLGQVFLTMRWNDVEARVQDARIRLLLGGPDPLLVSTLVVVALIGGILQSVQKVLDTMRHLQSEDSGFDLEGNGEVGAIDAAFQQVASRMQAAECSAAQADGLRKDMVLAREIQETLLPEEPPDIKGYELAKWYQPAGDVGGDYYDFLAVNDDMVGIVVADVSGKGVSGSLVMSMLRTALRMEARDNTNAGDVLARMNAFLSADMRKGMFVTMFYVILDSRNRVVSYASAGHTPMVLYRAETAETFFLKPRGFPVGLKLPDDQTFGRSLDVERLQLHEGDLLLLYTDGITEAMNSQRDQYGEDRLLEVIRQTAGGSAQGCVDAIREDMRQFCGQAQQSDDVTLVAIRETSNVRETKGSIRQRLTDLVETQGMSVEEACATLHVSPSTYYRFQHVDRSPLRKQTTSSEAASAASAEPEATDAAPVPAADAGPATDAASTAADTAKPASASNKTDDSQPAAAATSSPVQSADLQARAAPISGNAAAAMVYLDGFIDSSSCAEMEAFLRGLDTSWTQLIVDLSGILYLSSRAWGLLATAAADLQRRDGALLLTGLNAEVADVHKMLGFEEVLPSFATREQAQQALQSASDASNGSDSDEAEESDDNGSGKQRRHRKPRPRSEAKLRRKQLKKNATSNESEPPSAHVAAIEKLAGGSAAQPATPTAPAESHTAGEWESLRVISGCVGPAGEVRLLGIEGVLDTVSTRRFGDVLEACMQQGDKRILVDLSRTEFISSAGWGIFTSGLRELREQQGDLKLFGMGRELQHIFAMLGLGAVLESFDVMSAALEAFGLVASEEVTHESHQTQMPAGDIEARQDTSGPATSIGKLQVQVQPFGNSGTATRLIMEGELSGSDREELEAWLRANNASAIDSGRLLLLDARRVHAVEENHWLNLLEGTANQGDSWGSVHMLRPQTHCALPVDLAFPVHETLEQALEAFQNRSSASLQFSRLKPSSLFAADSSVRREGWERYRKLLVQAQGGKEEE